MGVAYYYFCDSCNKVVMKPIIPFEPSDPGEETPEGWGWFYNTNDDDILLCYDCQ